MQIMVKCFDTNLLVLCL